MYLEKINLFVKHIDKIDCHNKKRIVFLEQSHPLELLLLIIIIKKCSCKISQIWFVLRGEQEDTNLLFLKFSNYILRKTTTTIHYMSDSELVANYMRKKIDMDVDVIPIPHTDINEKKLVKMNLNIRYYL